MNEALNMQISAFVDGELPDNEAELLLRRLSQDAELRQKVAEYLEIGRVLRRERDLPGMDLLRGRIAAAIGDDAEIEPEAPEIASRLMTPTTGIAVAATVAAVALIGLGQISGPEAGVDTGAIPVAIDTAPMYTEPTPEQVLANRPSERLRDMYRRHGESAPELGSGDILYRMATFELRAGELVEIEPDPHLIGAEDSSSDSPDPVEADERTVGQE